MANPATLLISPMRNEGPFILEWLAWHRMMGFQKIMILSNDCTDGSDTLLDALQDRGLIEHRPYHPEAGSFALRTAYRVAQESPSLAKADWVMILDADEFLVVHTGARRVSDLLDHVGCGPLGIAVHWKCFGDNGFQRWEDGLVRHQFTRCAAPKDAANMRFKSIFRDAGNFASFRSHAPQGYKGEENADAIWVTSDGQKLAKFAPHSGERIQSTAKKRITHEIAQINHYAIKAQDCLIERRLKWTSSNRDYRYGNDFIERYNTNEEEDLSALQDEQAFLSHYEPLRRDPELGHLHEACCRAYRQTLDQNRT